MLAMITKGRDPAGLAAYMADGKDRAGRVRETVRILVATIPGRTATEYGRSFRSLARLRSRLKRNTSHIVVSWRKDAPQPTDATAAAVCEALATRLGYDAFLAVRHDGHAHIAALRIRLDGSVVPDSNDFARAERIVRDLEQEYGLAPDRPSRHTDPAAEPARAYGRKEAGRYHRTGEVPARLAIAAAIDSALGEGRATTTVLASRLAARGVRMTLHVATTGRVAGATFDLGGVVMKGSKVGKPYSWAGLIKRGVTYEHDGQHAAEGPGRPGEAGPTDPARGHGRGVATGPGRGLGPDAGRDAGYGLGPRDPGAPDADRGRASQAGEGDAHGVGRDRGPAPASGPRPDRGGAVRGGSHGDGERPGGHGPGGHDRPGDGMARPGRGDRDAGAPGGAAPPNGGGPAPGGGAARGPREYLVGLESAPPLTADRAAFLRAHNRARQRYAGAAADLAAVLGLLRAGFSPERVKTAWRAAVGEPVGAALAARIRRTIAHAIDLLRNPPAGRAKASAPRPRP